MTAAGSGRWVAFTARDTVIVRDGRSFDADPTAGAGSWATLVAPWPSTVAGAVTSAFWDRAKPTGFIEPDQVRGPVLARCDGAEWTAYFPVPADLALPQDEARLARPLACRLRPAELSVGGVPVETDLASALESWMAPPEGMDAVEPLGGLFPIGSMTAYLADELGERPDLRGFGWLKPQESPLVPEPRVGLARDGRTARDGYLYSMTHLRPEDGWAFLAECVDSAATLDVEPNGPVPLGGKARLADVETAAGVAWPTGPVSFPQGRVLLYVATPGIWEGGWRPPLPAGVRLLGACVPDAVAVATASVRSARAQRRALLETVVLRWAVPAGAVYLLQFGDGADAEGSAGQDAEQRAATWAASIHGAALGPARHPGGGSAADGPGSRGTDRTSTAGFGVVLTGRWSPRPTPAAPARPGSR